VPTDMCHVNKERRSGPCFEKSQVEQIIRIKLKAAPRFIWLTRPRLMRLRRLVEKDCSNQKENEYSESASGQITR
jgi:hypothetical protein